MRPTRRELTRACRRLPAALPVVAELPGVALGAELRLLLVDRHLLGIFAGEADADTWSLPARPEALAERLSVRSLAVLAGCSRRTIHRSLARLEAVGLVVRDRAAWLASRYVIAAEQLVERSAAWLRELAERGLARARAWVARNPFRHPQAGGVGSEAARRVRQAPDLDDQALAELAPSPALVQPSGENDLEAWLAWALGQADELLRARGIPRWAQSRATSPANFARITLAWGALRRPDASAERVWSFAEGHARRMLPHWRAVQEGDLEGLLWTLGLVWWAHRAGKLRNWTLDSSGRAIHRPIGLDEWLRCRPSRWETAVSQAEAAWATRTEGDIEAEHAAEHLHPPIAAAAPGLVEASRELAEPAVEPAAEDLVHPDQVVCEVLAELPRFRAGLEALVAEALRLPAGRMRTHGLRANLKLLAGAPAEPRRWVVRVVEEALKQAEALRRWVTERTRPGG